MSGTDSTPLPPTPEPPVQDLRFAIVMYGGVSLAIYLNGIAQELLHMVVGTASDPGGKPWLPFDQLTGTQKIYRRLGQLLAVGQPASARTLEHLAQLQGDPAIRTRLIVDVLSGTSAGGINAVFLAKALAMNQRDLDVLRTMWMEEADIGKLLNDDGSEPAVYPTGPVPKSLLNSRRMYEKLLEAFDRMDRAASEKGWVRKDNRSALVDDLDLFVTATDLNGIETPIETADKVLSERVHKLVFHFQHAPEGANAPDHFASGFNPMLAFSARCTSSFPAAFEPMTLDATGRVPDAVLNGAHPWRRFFLPYLQTARDASQFWLRPLADGGYLDNKPFGHAINAILRRHGHLGARKLFFLDPFPEMARESFARDINFVDNAMLAAMTLPRYETIRQDLEELNAHNRQTHRINAIIEDVDRLAREPDIAAMIGKIGRGEYGQLNLAAFIRESGSGPSYIGYSRLRIDHVTSSLALLVTRLIGFNDDSDELEAIRQLVAVWRQRHFSPEAGKSASTDPDLDLSTLSPLPENQFLLRYDVSFRLRRVDRLREAIDQLRVLLCSPAPARDAALTERGLPTPAGDAQTVAALHRLNAAADELADAQLELHRTRDILWLAFREEVLTPETAALRGRLSGKVAALANSVSRPGLLSILEANTVEGYTRRAAAVLDSPANGLDTAIDSAAAELAAILDDAFTTLNIRKNKALGKADDDLPFFNAIRLHLREVWDRFDYYDSLTYPVSAGNDLGETRPIEAFRISPADTRLLTTSAGTDKLSGTALGAFGAFLAAPYRSNDMMWGRLDGTERIFRAVLPLPEDSKLRDHLTRQAFEEILAQEFTPQQLGPAFAPLLQQLRQQIGANTRLTPDEFYIRAGQIAEKQFPTVIQGIIRAISTGPARVEFFRAFYQKPAQIPVPEQLTLSRRAGHILSGMLGGLSNPLLRRLSSPVNLVSSLGTRFVEFALPDTFRFRTHWQWLLMLSALLLVLIGQFIMPSVQIAGWLAVLAVIALMFATRSVGAFISGGPGVSRWAVRAVLIFAALLVFLYNRPVREGFATVLRWIASLADRGGPL